VALAPAGGWRPLVEVVTKAKADTERDIPKGAAEGGEAPDVVPAG
jgi:hypothetical protein